MDGHYSPNQAMRKEEIVRAASSLHSKRDTVERMKSIAL